MYSDEFLDVISKQVVASCFEMFQCYESSRKEANYYYIS
jgi:hypothetical protein